MKKLLDVLFTIIFSFGMTFIFRGGAEYYAGEFTMIDANLVGIGVVFMISGMIYQYKFKPAAKKKLKLH